jgi:hypothetical protein
LQIQDEEENWYYFFKCAFGDAKVWTILPCNIMDFSIQKQWDGLSKVTIFMKMHDDAPSNKVG